jgi:hypothetical protein
MYRSCSLATIARQVTRNKLDLEGVQDVRWDKGGTVREQDYTFFLVKGNENQQLGTGFFVHYRILSAGKIVEFARYRMSYIVMRGHL